MGKRNNMRLQAETGNIGCMWGLIRMLHFRRDPKMILDQREGNRQYLINRFSKGITSGEINEINEEDSDADQSNSKSTVKKLMEKEMNRSKIGKTKIPTDEIDKILSDWGHKIEPDNKKSKKRRPKPYSNQKPKSISNTNTNTNSTENSDLEVVIASFLVEIYRYHNECQLCKNKKGLCPTLKSIVYSKLNDLSTAPEHSTTIGERHLSNTGVCESKEFMNALEILGSNKELFLKILQDPDSHVLEKVQEITEKRDMKRFFRIKEEKVQGINERRDTKWFSRRKEEDEKDQLINDKKDVKRFFGRKDEEDKTNISPSASKIVVLKPKATAKPSYDAKAISHFSFREIKKRLKQIIGETAKERTERTDPYLFKVVNGMNKPYRPVRTAVGSSFYEEAKKHLMDILRTGNEPENAKDEHASVPLGKILSLTQNNLELDSGQKGEKDDNGIKSGCLTKEGLESIVSIKEDNEENIIKNENTKPKTQLEACCEEMTTKETVDTVEIKIEDSTESIPVIDAPVEATSGECTILSETSKEDPVPELAEEFKQAEEELIEGPISIISDSVENSTIEKSDCHSPEPSTSYSCKESYCEKTDQPSPISVLEPFFADDAPSPNCKNTDHDKLHRCLWPAWPNQTSLLADASARSEFIESVLESSELCKEENLERWHLEEELLDPSLFDQLDISPDQIDDFRLLFDCICEVLTEIQHKYFRFSQQMPVRKRNLLQEVCQGVSWHLRYKHPFFLDQVIRSDLDCVSWCDLREETESIVVEMWDEFIDDLLEETVFDLWL